jgi:3-oxoacyl-[acyl-carrier protein] reductase|tara:strand:+ start:1002 stop:1787 length:786 start_codon:yes stop_codon:yes gene_type:complete
MKTINLQNKVALITGGSSGLGKAIAKEFVSCGASVCIIARTAANIEETVHEIQSVGSGQIRGFVCDITDQEKTAEVLDQIILELGGVDILVNNAGSSSRKNADELTTEDMILDMDLKLFANMRLVQLCLGQMRAKRWGRIINIVSIGGKVPGGSSAPTALSRASGITWTKILATELAPDNVLVNALCIGKIKSGQWERRYAASGSNDSYEEFLSPVAKTIPIGRLGESEELANVACFLASDLASYVTGVALNVDGGLCPVT